MCLIAQRWLDKENVVYRDCRVLFSHKEEWNNVICKEMDETKDQEIIMLRKISQTQKDKYHMFSLTYAI
jgi:hypothetical protein